MKFSVFKNLEGNNPGKSVSIVGGELVGKTIGQFTRAHVTTEELDLAGLVAFIKSSDSTMHLTAGIASKPESVAITSKAFQVRFHSQQFTDEATGLPLVTRTKASLPFPEGPGLMVIDCDGDSDHLAELYQGNPVLRDYAHIETTSSSSMLFDSDGNQLKGKRGVHVMFHVKNGEDIPRALDTLHARQIIAGFGKHKVSSDGRFLERSSVDLAMRSANQPVYLYATTADDIEQRKEVRLMPGTEVLDTEHAIPPLTESEQKALQDKLIEARIELAPKCDATREAWIDERVDEAVAKGTRKDVARKSVREAIDKGGRLGPHFVIHLSNGQSVTVAEICRNQETYHGIACCDPMEPGYSTSAAKIYTNFTPMIHSMAHGSGKRYHLQGHESSVSLEKLEENIAAWLERDTIALRGKPELMRWVDAPRLTGLDEFAGSNANGIVEAALKGFDLPDGVKVADCPHMLGIGVEAGDQIAICRFDVAGAVNYVSDIKPKDRIHFAQVWQMRFMPAVNFFDSEDGIERFLLDPIKKAAKLTIEETREQWATNAHMLAIQQAQTINDILPQARRLNTCDESDPEDSAADLLIEQAERIQGWLEECRHIAENPMVELENEMEIRGISGEFPIKALALLTAHSTHMAKPLAAAVKGQSSSGKSYVTTQVLALYPPEFIYMMTGGSPKSLVYEAEEFCHRLIYLAEAEALVRDSGDEKNDFAEILRVLVSEQRIEYKYVAKDETGKMVTMTAERDGPVGFLTTTVRNRLDPELETRMLSAFSDESTEQTERILKGQAQIYDGSKRIVKNDSPWHAFAHWVRSGPNDAVVPFAQPLERLIPKNAVRVRRDFTSIIMLIKVSAIVHRLNRRTNEEGKVIAQLEDYRTAYAICSEGFKVSAGSGLTQASIEMLDLLKQTLVFKNWPDGLLPARVFETPDDEFTGRTTLCPFALAENPGLQPSDEEVRNSATRREYVRHELQGTFASIGIALGMNEVTLRKRIYTLKDAGFVGVMSKKGSGGTTRIWLTDVAAGELDDGVEMPSPDGLARAMEPVPIKKKPWEQPKAAT
jgi:hypothetical protein